MWILPKDTLIVAKKLKDVKLGEWFTIVPIEEPKSKQIWVKGHYERSDKKFYCYKYDDINHEKAFKADKIVYTEFIF